MLNDSHSSRRHTEGRDFMLRNLFFIQIALVELEWESQTHTQTLDRYVYYNPCSFTEETNLLSINIRIAESIGLSYNAELQ